MLGNAQRRGEIASGAATNRLAPGRAGGEREDLPELERAPAFWVDGRAVSQGDVVAASWIAGCLDELERTATECCACARLAEAEGIDLDPDEHRSSVDAWRRELRLFSVDETEEWLATHALLLDELSEIVRRRLLRLRLADRIGEALARCRPARSQALSLLCREAAFAGLVPHLVEETALRAVALPAASVEALLEERRALVDERGVRDDRELFAALESLGVRSPDAARFVVDIEAAYRLKLREVGTDREMARVLDRHRAGLVALELVTTLHPREGAARELLCCVKHDGASFPEATARARSRCVRSTRIVEDLPQSASRLAVAREGEVVGPIETPAGFEVIQVLARRAPTLADPEVVSRLRRRLVLPLLLDEKSRRVRLARAGALLP